MSIADQITFINKHDPLWREHGCPPLKLALLNGKYAAAWRHDSRWWVNGRPPPARCRLEIVGIDKHTGRPAWFPVKGLRRPERLRDVTLVERNLEARIGGDRSMFARSQRRRKEPLGLSPGSSSPGATTDDFCR